MDAPVVEIDVDYVQIAREYAERVVGGVRLAGSLEILACKRFIADLKKSKSKKFQYELNHDLANDACDFISKCRHVEGDLAGEEIGVILDYWAFVVVNIFGWVERGTHNRRFHYGYMEITRKAAKSTMLAAITLYLQACDGVGGAKIVIGASTEKQADKVFGPAKNMITQDPDLAEEFGFSATSKIIRCAETNGEILKVQSAGEREDGWILLAAILDEFHAHKDSSLYDVLESGMGSIQNWMMLMITTAGRTTDCVCWRERTRMVRILEGKTFADDTFCIIFTIDDGDDPYDIEVLEKANPQLDKIIKRDTVESLARKAKEVHDAEFLRTRANKWDGAAHAYFPMHDYDLCPVLDVDFDWTQGRSYAAVDLATKLDIAGYGIFVDLGEQIAMRHRYYVPEKYKDYLRDQERIELYARWITDGWLTVSGEEEINQNDIQRDLLADMGDLPNFEMVAFDTYQGAQMMNTVSDEGFDVVGYAKSTPNFSQPTKDLKECMIVKKVLREGKLINGELVSNPVTRSMFANVHCTVDNNGNVFPKKEHKNSDRKIDGAIMSVMCNGMRLKDIEGEEDVDDTNRFARGGGVVSLR